MKLTCSILSLALLGLLSAASAKPIKARVKTSGQASIDCYIVKYDTQGISFSASPNGASPRPLSHANIASIELDAPDTWSAATLAWNEKNYKSAATQFGILADDYANIGLFTNEYGAKARYYQLQALKMTGDYATLEKVINQVRTSTPISLDGYLKDQLAMLGGWALLSKKEWDKVIAFVNSYQVAVPGHPRPGFKPGVSREQIVELSYLRGLARIAKKDEDGGLEDLQRSITVDFGSNPEVSKNAATAILDVLRTRSDDASKREAYGTAIFLKNVVGGGMIDAKYEPLLVKPKGLDVATEDDEKPASDAPKPGAAPAAATPAPKGKAPAPAKK